MIKNKINETKFIELSIILLLIILIYHLGQSDNLKYFIHPKYYALIIFSLFFLLFIAIYQINNLFKTNKNLSRNFFSIKYLLFIIIIILGFKPYDKNFITDISKLRGINLGDLTVYKNNVDINNKNLDLTNDFIKSNNFENRSDITENNNEDIIFTDENYFDLTNKISRNPENYLNKKVKISGFVFYLKGENITNFVIGRMGIVCCAADAVVIGILADVKKFNHNFIEGEWYEFSGIIKNDDIILYKELKRVPVIEINNFRKIKQPDNIYVYPSYY